MKQDKTFEFINSLTEFIPTYFSSNGVIERENGMENWSMNEILDYCDLFLKNIKSFFLRMTLKIHLL